MLKKLFLSILLILVICAPSLAADLQINLAQGWNLKSSRIAINPSETFSDDTKFASVWKWIPGANAKWAVYLPGESPQGKYAGAKGFSVLSTISPGEGFWVNSEGTQSVTVTGTEEDINTISLVEGWNLKGLKTDGCITVSSIFSDSTKFASVWKWESGAWAVYLPGESPQGEYAGAKGFSPLSTISPGEGFWVNATAAGAGEFEPMPPLIEAQVLDSTFPGKYVPVQGAEVYFKEVKIADTDINGLFGFGVVYGVVLNAETGAGLEGVQISTDYGVKAVSLPKGAYLLIHPPGNFILKAELAGYNPFEFDIEVGSLSYKEVSISMALQASKLITRINSLYKSLYSVTQDIPITVKANRYLTKTATLNLSAGLRDHFFIREEEDVPEESFGKNKLDVGKEQFDVSTFKTCPNLFVLEPPPEAIPAKPTPKVISDEQSAIIITRMKLEKDITVAVQTFGSEDNIENLTSINETLGAAQASHIIGGADVLISDSDGSPITSEASGFSARVRAVTKENLSDSALSFAQMKSAIDSGTGEVYLFYYHEYKWQMAGAGVIKAKNSTYQAVSGEGIFFEGLYPFLFVYAGKKVITGKVVEETMEGTEPVPNALITITNSRDTIVSGSDGTFSISIPDALTSVRLKILHEDYYITVKTVTFVNETKKDVGNIFLAPLIRKTLQGTVVTHNQAPVANAEVVVTIQNKPANIIFPDVIRTRTGSDGAYTIAGLPVDVLEGAVVNVITEDGYDPGFKTFIPASETDTITLDFVLVAPLWTYQTNGNIYSSPTIKDGKIYIGSCDGKLYSLDAVTGTESWAYATNPDYEPLPIFATPAVDVSNVYFGTLSNQLYALGQSAGEKAWDTLSIDVTPKFAGSLPPGNHDIIASPVLSGNGGLFAGSSYGNFANINIEDGTSFWIEYFYNNITSSPIYHNNRVYFGTWDGYFYCIEIGPNLVEHVQIWRFPTEGADALPGRILSSPTIVDGKVYFGGGNNLTEGGGGASVTDGDTNIYCLDASNGSLIWKYETGGAIVSSPAVVGGKLYVGSLDGKVYCLNISNESNIQEEWTYTTGGEVYSSPFVSNGKVYIGSDDNYLYCLDAATGDKLWSFKTRGEVISSPEVDNGKIYFGSLDGVIYCVEE